MMGEKILKEIKKWRRTSWMIEGDIKSYFDNINHKKLHEILSKYIQDKNLLDLIKKLVKVGYIENRKSIKNDKGVAQGGILSPLLSNIYLHELDMYIEKLKQEYNVPLKNVTEPAYKNQYNKILQALRKWKKDRIEENLRKLREEKRKMMKITPSSTQGFKINYVRYTPPRKGEYHDMQMIL